MEDWRANNMSAMERKWLNDTIGLVLQARFPYQMTKVDHISFAIANNLLLDVFNEYSLSIHKYFTKKVVLSYNCYQGMIKRNIGCKLNRDCRIS